MAAPISNFEFFIEISQGLLRTAQGLVRTCEISENRVNPCPPKRIATVLGILELSCQGLGILELSWQGLKYTGKSSVSTGTMYPWQILFQILLRSIIIRRSYLITMDENLRYKKPLYLRYKRQRLNRKAHFTQQRLFLLVSIIKMLQHGLITDSGLRNSDENPTK